MYNYITVFHVTRFFLKKRKIEKEERSRLPQRIFHFLGQIYCYYVLTGIPKFSIVQIFSISSHRNNYQIVLKLAHDKKQKIGMKLGGVVTCTTHCPDQFFLLLSTFLVWPFSQAHGTCLRYALQALEARRLQPHLQKAGLNWSKSRPNHLFSIQNQAPHMAHTVHTIHLQILLSSI